MEILARIDFEAVERRLKRIKYAARLSISVTLSSQSS